LRGRCEPVDLQLGDVEPVFDRLKVWAVWRKISENGDVPTFVKLSTCRGIVYRQVILEKATGVFASLEERAEAAVQDVRITSPGKGVGVENRLGGVPSRGCPPYVHRERMREMRSADASSTWNASHNRT